MSNITLLGRLTNKEVLCQIVNCDFYISNSNFETFGMTIAEALMAGKPVISTLSGGPNEFLTSNNSIIVSKKDNNDLSKAIIKMSDKYSIFDSNEITSRIESKYGKKVIVEKMKKFYTL